MSQADMEKAYVEAVDLLAHAEEANRLLTERIATQEMELAQLRGGLLDVATVCDSTTRGGLIGHIRQIIEKLDLPHRQSQNEQPPASPDVPT